MYRTITFGTLFLILFTASQSFAQKDPVISVTGQGEVELPADIIQFNINMNAEGDTPQDAYNLHQKREKVLVQLLEQYDIQEKNIRFQPISINKSFTDEMVPGQGRQRKEIFRTNQQVSLELSDFDVYEKIQVTLIENDFDQFSGNFRSSEQVEGEDQALRNAIQQAQKKAGIIADEANLTLGDIQSINYHDVQYSPRGQLESMAMRADSQSLMQYEQTVVVRASVSIQFGIE